VVSVVGVALSVVDSVVVSVVSVVGSGVSVVVVGAVVVVEIGRGACSERAADRAEDQWIDE
jgi:hypothetical protein